MNRDELKEEIARLTDAEGNCVAVARTVEASQPLFTVIKQTRDFLTEHQATYNSE